MILNTKKQKLTAVLKDSTERPERLTLSESRNMIYEKFRINTRTLWGTTNLSGVELAKEMGIESGSKFSNLLYGRANPRYEDIACIAKFFNISIDDLMNKTATITFQ